MSNSTTDGPAIATTRTCCKVSPLTQSDRAIIARVLSWDMYTDVQAHEVITIAITNDIVQVKLTGGRAALLSVDTFKLILEQQRQQLDQEVVYVEQLEQKLEKDSNEIKLARVDKIYPVWRRLQLLSTFYPVGRDWNWQVANGKPRSRFRTAATAQNSFVQLPTSDEDKEVAA